jgi:hypothetical protein
MKENSKMNPSTTQAQEIPKSSTAEHSKTQTSASQ